MMQTLESVSASPRSEPGAEAGAFYRRALGALSNAGVPHLIGGALALAHHTGIRRYTKDLDIFVRPEDAEWALATIATAGYRAEMVAPHWLGKAHYGDAFIDVIFSSGNGVCVVDDHWFKHADLGRVLGLPVLLSPVEEMIWSKAFVLERERFDGADVTHLIRACGRKLDWERLYRRFDPHWQVFFAHLMLFRFSYPSERDVIPTWVMRALGERTKEEVATPPPEERICRGTLLSARQYLVDVEHWGFADGRLDPEVQMNEADIAQLTQEVRNKEKDARTEVGGRR